MEYEKFIRFSSPLFRGGLEKLKVLYCDDGILALDKPVGMLIDAYPWYPGMGSIVAALKQEKLNGKLEEYHLDNIYSIYSLEPEVSGVALLANGKETSNFLRNELGSGKFIFKFALLVKGESGANVLECDLPLAKHYREDTVLVSNKTGKKCKTQFTLKAKFGAYQLWEAQTDYPRMHQIRVHAMERGLHIVGEEVYTEASSPRSLAFKGAKKLEKKLIICDELCLHLSSVEWEQGGKRIVIKSPLPQGMSNIFEKGQAL